MNTDKLSTKICTPDNNESKIELIEESKKNTFSKPIDININEDYLNKSKYEINGDNIIKKDDDNKLDDIIYEQFKDMKFKDKNKDKFSSIEEDDSIEYQNMYEVLDKDNKITNQNINDNSNYNEPSLLKKKTERPKDISVNDSSFQRNKINMIQKLTPKKKTKKKRSNRDKYIKAFLSNFFNQFLFKRGNNLFKRCKFEKLKTYKIYKCNYKKMILKQIERNLAELINKTYVQIFTDYDEKEKEGIKNQKHNKELFVQIYEELKILPYTPERQEFKNFIESPISKLIIDYYHSKEFNEFKKKVYKDGKTVQDYDNEFFKERGRNYSLLEPYNFLRYANSKPYCHNQRKKKIK